MGRQPPPHLSQNHKEALCSEPALRAMGLYRHELMPSSPFGRRWVACLNHQTSSPLQGPGHESSGGPALDLSWSFDLAKVGAYVFGE